MKRIYVAGAISSPSVIQFLDNVRRGTRLSTECLLDGIQLVSEILKKRLTQPQGRTVSQRAQAVQGFQIYFFEGL